MEAVVGQDRAARQRGGAWLWEISSHKHNDIADRYLLLLVDQLRRGVLEAPFNVRPPSAYGIDSERHDVLKPISLSDLAQQLLTTQQLAVVGLPCPDASRLQANEAVRAKRAEALGKRQPAVKFGCSRTMSHEKTLSGRTVGKHRGNLAPIGAAFDMSAPLSHALCRNVDLSTITADENTDSNLRSNLAQKRVQAQTEQIKKCLTAAIKANRMLYGQKLTGAETLFRAMDRNGTKTLDQSELKHGLNRLGLGLTDAQMPEVMDALDMNDDGLVTQADFVEMLESVSELQSLPKKQHEQRVLQVRRRETATTRRIGGSIGDSEASRFDVSAQLEAWDSSDDDLTHHGSSSHSPVQQALTKRMAIANVNDGCGDLKKTEVDTTEPETTQVETETETETETESESDFELDGE